MSRSASTNNAQVTLQLPRGWLQRAEYLASRIAPHGIIITRADVLRAAIAKGLKELEGQK